MAPINQKQGDADGSETGSITGRKEWNEDEEAILKTAFLMFDKNGDGQIGLSDLEEGFSQKSSAAMDIRKSVLERAIESADANKDQELDFEEFKELMKNPIFDAAFEDEIENMSHAPKNEEEVSKMEELMLQRLGKAFLDNPSRDFRRSSVFGRLAVAEESGTDLVASVRALDTQLKRIPRSKKKMFLQAKEKCPQLVGDKFKIMFLRAEEYDAPRAATRLVGYWEERVRVFGPDKAFLPLTQTQALKDDLPVLETGIFKPMIPSTRRDDNGQSLFIADFHLDKNKEFDALSKLRAMWYAIHATLEQEDTPDGESNAQLHGVVYVARPWTSIKNADPKLLAKWIYTTRFYLPIRLACVHVCYVPPFAAVMERVVSMFAGEFKHRRKLHRGTTEQVLEALEGFGVPADCVPIEFGGTCDLSSYPKWLSDRREAGL